MIISKDYNDENLEKIYQLIKDVFKDSLEADYYLVGGCVRDSILGKIPKDYDMCTNLLPEEMKFILRKNNKHIYNIGEKFGTIGFKVQYQEKNSYDKYGIQPQWDSRVISQLIEMTTYRSELYSLKNRKPNVKFGTSLEKDLERRDFTINSIAYKEGKLYSLSESCFDDFDNKIIRCVGNPDERFNEDPLRMLRAIRFASEYDFEIDSNTEKSIERNIFKIYDVAIERVTEEIDKMLLSNNPNKAWKLLKSTCLSYTIFPETCVSDKELVKGGSIENNYSRIFTGSQHKEINKWMATGICLRMKFSNERIKKILSDFE